MIYKSFRLLNEERRYAVLISQYIKNKPRAVPFGTRGIVMVMALSQERQWRKAHRGVRFILETSEHNATAFATFDHSNSGDIARCARNMESGWWFDSESPCDSILNVNAPYKMPTGDSRKEGVSWRGRQYRKITVKIAPRFH